MLLDVVLKLSEALREIALLGIRSSTVRPCVEHAQQEGNSPDGKQTPGIKPGVPMASFASCPGSLADFASRGVMSRFCARNSQGR